MVWWHDRFGAYGPDTILWKTEQGWKCVQCAVQLESPVPPPGRAGSIVASLFHHGQLPDHKCGAAVRLGAGGLLFFSAPSSSGRLVAASTPWGPQLKPVVALAAVFISIGVQRSLFYSLAACQREKHLLSIEFCSSGSCSCLIILSRCFLLRVLHNFSELFENNFLEWFYSLHKCVSFC